MAEGALKEVVRHLSRWEVEEDTAKQPSTGFDNYHEQSALKRFEGEIELRDSCTSDCQARNFLVLWTLCPEEGAKREWHPKPSVYILIKASVRVTVSA